MQKQTTVVKPSDITRKWYVVDAENIPLGRLASKVAMILTGKSKPTFQPNLDTGDYVIIVNAQKVLLTGNKESQKKYYNVSGRLGGLRTRSAKVMRQEYPVKVIELAVKGMLPKGPLGRQMFTKLHVYAGAEHKNQAQQPEVLVIK